MAVSTAALISYDTLGYYLSLVCFSPAVVHVPISNPQTAVNPLALN